MKFINKILIIYIYNQNSGLGHFKRMKSLHSVFRRSKFFCDLKKVRNNSDLKKINVQKYQKILIDINFRAFEAVSFGSFIVIILVYINYTSIILIF